MAIIDTINAKARNYLKKTGDAMIGGFLTLFQDPTDPLHAVTKQYVDNLAGGGQLDERHVGLIQQTGRGTGVTTTALTTNSATGTASLFEDATGCYLNYLSTTLLGAQAGWSHAATIDYAMRFLPDIYIVNKTGAAASDIANIRTWVGLSTNTGLGNPLVGSFCGFRFNPADGDTTWNTLTSDGASSTVTSVGGTVTVDTRYVFRIKVVSTSSVEFYLNGTLVATHTTNLPAAATALGMNTYVINTSAGTARNWRVRRWQSQMR